MFSLSKESENDLKTELIKIVNNHLKNAQRLEPKALGLMSAKEVINELNIDRRTLKKWEDLGLKRYAPPYDKTQKHFYRVVDVLQFLGVYEETTRQ